MDYNVLTPAYWQSQRARVSGVREKIVARTNALPGRVVPEEDDLVIGQGRRLPLAVMFLDISGFSSRQSESVEEQEMLLRVLNLFFSEMVKIAEDYGGTVEKNTGDGLMAYFEDDILGTTGVHKAVASALTMFAANDHLISPILRATPVPEIKFRVSIDYGNVTIGRLGAAQRFNALVAIGATANFASKMLTLAQPGQIVLGATAYAKLPLVWQTQYAKLHTLTTGWIYQATGAAYSLYEYTGRWKLPNV
ncbi:MAG TPA: adenylate/guanylate cyclase domain-containing protein [Thermoanaerobaculia bacterium]|jgi:adenylate cyclase|nr:adenylate/guanylate cyclase domain-containing protein [Thermoanaerobaculia bacterium]